METRIGSVIAKGALPTFLGVLLLAVAAILGARTRAFIGSAHAAPGIVAGLNAGGSHPQIEFTTPTGDRISYPQGGLIFGYRPGQPVRVLFDARNPAETARLDAVGALWFDTIGLSFVGTIFLIVGMSGLLKLRSIRT